MKKYDLAVIGGGFAGVAAALAAARGGADVIIIEKSNALGGAANICLVNPFIPYKTKVDGKEVALSAGIFREIHEKFGEVLVEIHPCRGLCSFYAEKGGLLVGYEKM